ncbi:MAG TPA: polymer-forming cytoskeletal protein [Thermoanaerobaculia bacterium]|nr:polymer-forming cytoskeletal protein [Thermoanaerobaculia bacterium]
MFKGSGGGQSEINGFLDKGSRLSGELSFDASFRIDGNFNGKITSQGRLVVGEGGVVDGEIQVREVLVSGELRGNVKAGERIHITAGGRVFADLSTPSLLIEDGAVFEGRCSMNRGAGEPGVPKLVAADEG